MRIKPEDSKVYICSACGTFFPSSLDKCKKTYGSVERWVYDCVGDIIGAILCAAIVVF